MNTQSRQTVLRILLPAMAIGALYIWAIGGPKNKETVAAEKKLDRLAKQVGEDGELILVERQLKRVKDREQTLGQDERLVVKETMVRPALESTLPEVVRELTALITKHDLIITQDGKPDRTIGATLPEYLMPIDVAIARSVAKTDADTPSTKAQLWQVEFVGTYDDVSRLMSALAESNLSVHPVSLNMANASVDSRERGWTLLVWI